MTLQTHSRDHSRSIRGRFIRPIFKSWGYPQEDVFADRSNSKCPLFCTRCVCVDPLSLGDDLHLDWSGLLFYLFPSLPLLPLVLRKVQSQPAHAILIAPSWPRQNWFPFYNSQGEPSVDYWKLQISFASNLKESPSQHPQSGAHGVENGSQDFSDGVSNVILNSKKPPTRCSYASKWAGFCVWFGASHGPSATTSLPLVFNFLLSLGFMGITFIHKLHYLCRFLLTFFSPYFQMVSEGDAPCLSTNETSCSTLGLTIGVTMSHETPV